MHLEIHYLVYTVRQSVYNATAMTYKIKIYYFEKIVLTNEICEKSQNLKFNLPNKQFICINFDTDSSHIIQPAITPLKASNGT